MLVCWAIAGVQQGWIVLVYWTTAGMDCAGILDLQQGWIVLVYWTTAGLDCASMLGDSRAGLC